MVDLATSLIGIELDLSDHIRPLNIEMSPFINIKYQVDMCNHHRK